MDKIRLLIADDHEMFRTAMVALLAKEPEVEVVGQAANGAMAIQVASALQPDVILMDVDLPKMDGIEASRLILAHHHTARILALTSMEDEASVLGMIRAGAQGYLLKDAPVDELMLAIKALAKGGAYFAKDVSAKLLAVLQRTETPSLSKRSPSETPLTRRETEVLRCIAEEMTNKEIAAELFISPRTVETHRRNLINKLKVKNTAGLVRYYLSFGQDWNHDALAVP